MISSTFAMLPNGSIGHKNSLPWKGQKYKEIARRDMEHFKNVTEGKSVVMGYNTFESLNFKPLKNRLNHFIITSRDLPLNLPDNVIEINICDFIDKFKDSEEEVVCIGGSMLYDTLLKYSKVVYRSIFYIEELMDIYHDTYFSDISSLYLLWKFIPAQLEIHTVGDYRLAIEKFIRWQNTMDN